MSNKNYLSKLAQWSEDQAASIAAEDAIELNAEHIQVLDAARRFYDQYGFSPSMRPLCKTVPSTAGSRKVAVYICCNCSPAARPS